jgi:hypothetical protein
MSDSSCRTFRELIGVYVVGAIDPAERSSIEAHLSRCHDCRDELAGLALLPALMHRIPVEEAERITADGAADTSVVVSSSDMLPALLKRVTARRRTRRVRSAFTVAAAVLIAAGGGAVAVSQAGGNGQPIGSHTTRVTDVTSARVGNRTATVRYDKAPWGTSMSVRVKGFSEGTWCRFWVIARDGTRSLAGAWMVGSGGDELWYPVRASVPEDRITGFLITSPGSPPLPIPAA